MANVCGIDFTKFTDDLIAAGAAKTLTVDANNNDTVLLDTATGGSTVTLPAATGSGATFKFVVSVLATSPAGHIVKVANTSDTMKGVIANVGTLPAGSATAFATDATSDTITLNAGNKTGNAAVGEWLEVRDIAANVWAVRGFVTSSGTPATPFSATV